jgi:hypothetical protein
LGTAIQQQGFTVSLHERNVDNREKGVDGALTTAMACTMTGVRRQLLLTARASVSSATNVLFIKVSSLFCLLFPSGFALPLPFLKDDEKEVMYLKVFLE